MNDIDHELHWHSIERPEAEEKIGILCAKYEAMIKELAGARARLSAARVENTNLRDLLGRVVTEVGRTITSELRADIEKALAGSER